MGLTLSHLRVPREVFSLWCGLIVRRLLTHCFFSILTRLKIY